MPTKNYSLIYVVTILLFYLSINPVWASCEYPHEVTDAIRWMNEINRPKYLSANTILRDYVESAPSISDTCLAYIYYQHGRSLSRIKKHHESIAFYKKAIAIRKKYYPKQHRNIVIPITNIGIRYFDLGRNYLLESQSYLDTAYQLNLVRQKLDMPLISSHPRICLYLGKIYARLGDYDEACFFLERSANLYKNTPSRKRDMFVAYDDLTSIMAINLANPDQALAWSDSAFAVTETYPGDSITMCLNRGIALKNLGNQLKDTFFYEKALIFFQKALELEKSYPNFNNKRLILNSLGMLLNKQKRPLQALNLFNQAIQINQEHKFFNSLSTNYHNIGWTLDNLGKFEESLVAYTKALQYIFSDFYPKNNLELPNSKEHFSFNKIGAISTLKNKAESLTKLSQLNPKHENYLFSALATYRLIDTLIESTRKGFVSEGSKFSLSKKVKPIYEIAIQTCQLWSERGGGQQAIEQAIYYAERSKAISLYENIKSQQAARLLLPEAEQEALFTSIRKRDFYEKELVLEKINEREASGIEELTQQLAFYKNRVNKKLEQLEVEYPKYYQLKFKPFQFSLSIIQNQCLNENRAIIEYFVGDSTVYAFYIQKDSSYILELSKDVALEKKVKALQKAAYAYHIEGTRSTKLYKNYADSLVNSAHHLYQQLLAPLKEKVTLTKELVIIPDGVLGYLPFDLLISELPTTNTNFQNHAYLIKDYQISYAYSATLLEEMSKKKHQIHTNDFLAFAPKFEDSKQLATHSNRLVDIRSSLGPLKFNIREVEALQNLLGGKILKHQVATKANFIKEASNYNILHLATHGKANDKMGDYSYLAFSKIKDSVENELLYNHDLYSLQLNADMVVLSACETGLGELQKGEGILSLARGFSYAGAKSIISTLWRINDESSKNLMVDFYKNLKTGSTKDAALRQAKLDYINTNPHETAHPFFWASFIAIGDMTPINFQHNHFLWWGFIGLLCLSLIFFGIKYFSKREETLA